MSRTTRKRAQYIHSRSLDDLVAEGGRVAASEDTPGEDIASSPSSLPLDLPAHTPGNLDDRRRLMSAFSVGYDGRHYRYNGYRYDRLEDAVAYARLMQARPLQQGDIRPPAQDERVESPNASDMTLMAARSISFEAGVYEYSGFRYDRLADAVRYADMRRDDGI